ncbi:hypothetical protein [Natronorubrum sulfidifaciens]|uniref:Uncharacterized protein n=1 Tax=Natronorubrum sulfidifaciens JCM 14089 TaxID=1230460 RepID=L9W6Y1_9EURY|nr:hypothetical protein [Natronorubrum sulfidifaciens]ELY45260.1 hypothetical protein C495_08310 [Natronorubrum sulfidifaciens JCM 14089]
MDEDAVDASDSELVQWRRDASTSRTVRLLWSLGVGTFFAAIGIIVFWRLYDLANQAGYGVVVIAVFAALVVTAFAFAVTSNTEQRLEALSRRLSIELPKGATLERAIDAVLGTIAMMGVIGGLMIAGRVVTQQGLLPGAGPFTGLAALSIPLALLALVLASFLQSVGAIDRDDRTIYLYEPEQAIDLEVVQSISTRQVGDAAILTLEYAQPGGQYVAGPRRIVVPPHIARELQSLVGERTV